MLQHNHSENNYSFKTQELNSYNSSGIYNPKGKKNTSKKVQAIVSKNIFAVTCIFVFLNC